MLNGEDDIRLLMEVDDSLHNSIFCSLTCHSLLFSSVDIGTALLNRCMSMIASDAMKEMMIQRPGAVGLELEVLLLSPFFRLNIEAQIITTIMIRLWASSK